MHWMASTVQRLCDQEESKFFHLYHTLRYDTEPTVTTARGNGFLLPGKLNDFLHFCRHVRPAHPPCPAKPTVYPIHVIVALRCEEPLRATTVRPSVHPYTRTRHHIPFRDQRRHCGLVGTFAVGRYKPCGRWKLPYSYIDRMKLRLRFRSA